MRNLLVFLILGVLAWQGYNAYEARAGGSEFHETVQSLDRESASEARSRCHCDGRVYCSQMTSCEETEFFGAQCPGVKMP